jgi:hypothetical protein
MGLTARQFYTMTQFLKLTFKSISVVTLNFNDAIFDRATR